MVVSILRTSRTSLWWKSEVGNLQARFGPVLLLPDLCLVLVWAGVSFVVFYCLLSPG